MGRCLGLFAIALFFAVITAGCLFPAKRPGGLCARVWVYSTDVNLDRSVVRGALDDWTIATMGRECFAWTSGEPSGPHQLRFVLVYTREKYVELRGSDDGYSTIAGLWLAKKGGTILLIPARFRAEDLRAVVVHEVGHALGLAHCEHLDSGMHAIIHNVPPPIKSVDQNAYCEAAGCD